MRVHKIFLAIPISMLFLSSCYFDNEEDLYGTDDSLKDCDTVLVSYASDIRPIIDARCIECHGSTPEEGASKYTSHNLLKIYLDGNKKGFIESITHTGTSDPMPDGGSKLPECEIRKLIIWINNGYPNN